MFFSPEKLIFMKDAQTFVFLLRDVLCDVYLKGRPVKFHGMWYSSFKTYMLFIPFHYKN